MKLKRSSQTEVKNNYMISLTDIMFLILLFFMLTTAFNQANPDDRSQKGLIINIPSSHNTTSVSFPIEITIDAQLNYFIDDEPVIFSDIKKVLQTKLATKPRNILLRVEKTLPIQIMIEIIDIAHTLNAPIAVETKQEDLPNE